MAITINGSTNTLTGVAVGGLPDGIVDTDMLAANAVTAAKATGSAKGITMADSWRITSHYTMTGTNLIQELSANWERSDTAAFTGIGSPMTESNGYFNFPETGIYLVRFHIQLQATTGGLQAIGALIRFKKGASGSFTTQAQSQDSGTANYYGSATAEAIIDVTDAANDQVAFVVQGTTSRQILGNSNYARTGVIFIRLGDT
tara:strand:- start:2186 stop:2791 length:606 start_codon:yes stop_codon:yes gene_type:complete